MRTRRRPRRIPFDDLDLPHRRIQPFEIEDLAKGDVATVAEVLVAMSPRDRYLRFGRPMPRIDAPLLAALAAVDDDRHFAVVARDAGRPVAMARVVAVRGEPGVGEIAVSVASTHTGRGLGRSLCREVLERAEAFGYDTVECYVLDGNDRALGLFRSLGFRFSADDGLLHGRLQIRRPAALGVAV